MPKSSSVLLKSVEVQRRLGISQQTLNRWRREAGFPEPVQIGRSKRWRAVDIDTWLQAQLETPQEEPDVSG